MKCDQCAWLYINRVFCHETGCPNSHKVYDLEQEKWIKEVGEADEEEEMFQ